MGVEGQTIEQDFKVVGTRPDRPDGIDKVTGRARFGMLMRQECFMQYAFARRMHMQGSSR